MRMDNYIITVARGFGSGGKRIAVELANQLGINCYENRILTLASQYSGYDESYFVEQDEKLKGALWVNQLAKLPVTTTPKPVLNKFKSDIRVFDAQKHIIENLAKTESCVIVGKCADYILKDYDNVLSVYIEAPRNHCLKNILRRMDVTVDEANDLITKTDKYRAEYYKFYTGGNYWTNPVNYDITLNSYRLGDDNCVAMIKNALKVKLGIDVSSVG